MDIGKQNENLTFYKGYEDEPEIILANSITSLHIWEGYFSDIFSNASTDCTPWCGFTRDYQELQGAYAENSDKPFLININEYLSDLYKYKGIKFEYTETESVYNTICKFLNDSLKCNLDVTMIIK